MSHTLNYIREELLLQVLQSRVREDTAGNTREVMGRIAKSINYAPSGDLSVIIDQDEFKQIRTN